MREEPTRFTAEEAESLMQLLDGVREERQAYHVYVESAEGIDGDTYMALAIVDGQLDLTAEEAQDLRERLARMKDKDWVGNCYVDVSKPIILSGVNAILEAIHEDWGDDDLDSDIDSAWRGA